MVPDLDKIAVYGESAGGYLAIHSGLTRPDMVKAVIAAYPITYIDSDWYSKASMDKSPFGSPQLPHKILDEHLAAMKEGQIVSSVEPPERLEIGILALQQGLFGEFFGQDERFLLDRVVKKKEAGEKGPFLFVLHGKGDTAVPCEQSVRFVKEWQDKFGEESATSEFPEGEHGFDVEASLDDEWMQRGLSGVTKAWIGGYNE